MPTAHLKNNGENTFSPLLRLVATLGIGFAGAAVATFAGLPAASLIGASLAVSLASLARLTGEIPTVLRDSAFTLIGCSLGSGMTSQALSAALHWPVSLVLLCLSVSCSMLLTGFTLRRFFGHSPQTALLSTSPGALSYTLALAASGIGDGRVIIVIQSVRLLLVTALVPFFLAHLGLQQLTGSSGGAAPPMAGLALVLVLTGSYILGLILHKRTMPAAYLLAGMVISSLAHATDLVTGRPPDWLLYTGFTLTGTVIGVRFSALPLADLRRLLAASLWVFFLSCLVAALFSALVSFFLQLPAGQVFVAFAPGGVEAMAAMAIALGYDPAFVAVHHLFRIVLLILLLPLALRMVGRDPHQL